MQLNRRLILAVGSLLATTSGVVQAADWAVDSSVLFYAEKDSQHQDRVSLAEPVLSITKNNAPDDYLNVTLVYDTLTGASPNGAYASSRTQTFTSPSGGSGYTVAPGYTPLDPSFKDSRTALSLSWMTPFSRESRYLAGLNFSSESDYTSLSGNYSFLNDFNNKQTTLTMGLAYSYDAINPHGGFQTPLSSISNNQSQSQAQPVTTTSASGNGAEGGGGTSFSLFDGKIKTTFDAILGVSHVLNRYTLLSFNYGISEVDGYQTDPYKIVPIYDAGGFPVDYVNEKRPGSRLKQTLKADIVTAIGKDSLHLSYRYFWDDWGIQANTYDIKYHLRLGESFYAEPHYRYSHQTEANFYVLGLSSAQAVPSYASSDLRLANMVTMTAGGMFGWKVSSDTTFTLNLEKMQQSGNSSPSSAVGDQRKHDMFPTVTATMVTLGVRTLF